MKRLLAWLLTAALLCSITACHPAVKPGDDTRPTQPTLPEPQEVADNRQPTGVPGIYTLGDPLEYDGNLTVTEAGGVLLYSFTAGGMNGAETQLLAVNAKSGEELGRLTLDASHRETGRLKDGGLYTVLASTGEITFYDAACRPQSTAVLPTKGFGYRLLISSDGRYALFDDPQTYFTCLCDLSEGRRVPLTKDFYIGELLGFDGTAFLFTDMDSHICRLDLAGAVTDTQAHKSAHLTGPYIVETNRRGYFVRTTLSPTLQFFPAHVEGEYAVAATEGYFASLTAQDGLRLYDLVKNRYTAVLELRAVRQVHFADEGTVVVLTEQDGVFTTYILILSELEWPFGFEQSEAADGAPQEDLFRPATGSEEVMVLVKQIYEKYGVKVFFETVDEEPEVATYLCPPSEEGERLVTLQRTDKYLAMLPAGIMREIRPGADVWMYLTKDVLQTDGSPSNVAGFCCEISGHPLVVMPTGGSESYYMETFAHECVHLLDMHVDAEWFDDWDKLSPAGSFAMSYSADISSQNVWYDAPNSEPYFLDAYCKTYPEEDRAVTGQKLFASYYSGTLYEAFQYPHIRAKAEYFCRMLRASFTCCAEADELYWETVLK